MNEKLIHKTCYVDLIGNSTLVDLEKMFCNHVFSRKNKEEIKETFHNFMNLKLANYLEEIKEGKTQIEIFNLGFAYLNKYFEFSNGYSVTLSYLNKISVKSVFFEDFGTEWFLFLNPSFYKPQTKKGLSPAEIKLGIKFILISALRVFYDTKLLMENIRNVEYYERKWFKVYKNRITEEQRELKLFLTWTVFHNNISKNLDFNRVHTGYQLRNSVLIRSILEEEKLLFEKFREYKVEDFLEFFSPKNELIENLERKEKLTALLEYVLTNFKATSFKDFDYMY